MLPSGEQLRALEVDGYLVLPSWLPTSEVKLLREETDDLALQHTSYSDRQWFVHDLQWSAAPPLLRLIAYQPTLNVLRMILGKDILAVSMTYARTDPGYPGMALHTDCQPYGSNIFGMKGSSPCMLRVLYYLDDLTDDCAPLRVIPSSHLALHADANPYRRYLSHPEEVEISCQAGSTVIINQRLFHATGANRSTVSRRLLAVAYRPEWARPIAPVPEHPAEGLDRMPPVVRTLFKSPNTGIESTTMPNYSRELPDEAPGLNITRWKRRNSGLD